MTNQQKLQHLYWRAGFGPRPEDVDASMSPRKALRKLLHESERYEPLDNPQMRYAELKPAFVASPVPAPVMDSRVTGMTTTPDQMATSANTPASVAELAPRALVAGTGKMRPPMLRRGQLTPAQRKMVNEGIRNAFYQMNIGWLDRMASSPAQLREKMTFFWHGHFACRVRQPASALQLNNTIRKLALSNFGDLLLAVSREPAMLQFLNNQQNRKQHPNENFAREVMELFTIGRGNYTEQDVKEGARAFTGWTSDENYQFAFREKQHDEGAKTFMGRTGNFGGDDVLKIILEQPKTAEFITTKIYRFFVNDTPNPAHIQPLAQAFYKSHYNISDLLEQMFSADWFYDAANVGNRIKSPIELLAGIKRTLGMQMDDPKPLIGYEKALGQTLFEPPNVAGWPGGRNWIDSSSLLLRLQLPQVLFRNAEFNVALKEDENDISPSVSKADRTFRQQVKTYLQLKPLGAFLAKVPVEQQPARLSEFLLQAPIRPENLALVQQTAAQAPADGRLRTMITSLLALPEYQLM